MSKENKVSSVIIGPAKPPEILLGISLYTPPITEDEERMLNDRFRMSKRKCCDTCGVTLHEEMRHNLYLQKKWFNACSLCYYAANMDQIPSFRLGKIVYLPHISQARFNSMLRCIWTMNYLRETDPENQDLEDMIGSMEELRGEIDIRVQNTIAYFTNSNPEVYVSMLGLIKREEYEQRHKLLQNFRWMPEKKVFEDEMGFWAQSEFSRLHPESVTDGMKDFISKYVPQFNIKGKER
jgi:hypothetical protein